MPDDPPEIIQNATAADFRARLERLAADTGIWKPSIDGRSDGAQALFQIVGRMAETLAERINRSPDKHFLAFLNLIGAHLRPPQPARVPMTFRLAKGAPDSGAFVPRTTQVAAPALAGQPEVRFEVERDLVLTPAQLAHAFVREPGADRYADYSFSAVGADTNRYLAFVGDQPIEHCLYLASEAALASVGTRTLMIEVSSRDSTTLRSLSIKWEYWNGVDWANLQVSDTTSDSGWVTSLVLEAPSPKHIVNGIQGHWLRACLSDPFPITAWSRDVAQPDQLQVQRSAVALDVIAMGLDDASSLTKLDVDQPGTIFTLVGDRHSQLFLAANEAFSRSGAQLTLDIALDQTAGGSGPINLTWSWWDGAKWNMLGKSARTTIPSRTADQFSDTTYGFTRAGTITFRVPALWKKHLIGDDSLERRWLKLEIQGMPYGVGSALQLPSIQRISLNYTWTLPRIERIALSSHSQVADYRPELIWANDVAVDQSKDFFPFGERPDFNTTCSIFDQELFSQAGAKAEIKILVANPVDPQPASGGLVRVKPTPDLMLSWDIFDGSEWRHVSESTPRDPGTRSSFSDNTRAFTLSQQTITFTVPTCTNLNHRDITKRPRLRARIARGMYGDPAGITRTTIGTAQVDIPKPAVFAPPIIVSVRMNYTSNVPSIVIDQCLTFNDFVYHNQLANLKNNRPFEPFTPPRESRPAIYLGFDRPMANLPMTLFIQVSPQPGLIAGDGQMVGGIPQLLWEYVSSAGWRDLAAQDETRAFAERGIVQFVGPGDWQVSSDFNLTRYWLRARWVAGTYRALPLLGRILTNTTWGVQGLLVSNEPLGSSNGVAGQRFQLSHTPILLGQIIDVREREAPDEAQQQALEELAGQPAVTPVLDSIGAIQGYWVRWTEVPDFHGSGPEDRHYTLDHLTGELHFGNGRHGRIPPIVASGIRALRYQHGGGVSGNVDVGRINQLKSAIPYVEGVSNLEAAEGGTDAETLDQVRERGPKLLRHRGRVVAADDLADLAIEASPDVARALAIPPAFDALKVDWIDPSIPVPPLTALTGHTKIRSGLIELVIIPRSRDDQPTPSRELIDRVDDYLRTRCSWATDLTISGPDWVTVTISATVAPVSLESALTLQAVIVQTLRAFLHPLSGGLQERGWPFGRTPQRSDIYRLIEEIPGVDHVEALEIQQDPEQPNRPDRFLVVSGPHSIRLVGFSEDR